jgi:hypothetical protein
MTPNQEKRLRNVVVALRDAADDKLLRELFTMKRYGWGSENFDSDDPERKYIDVHKCGTPACAIGHFAARRDLQSFLTLNAKSGDLEFIRNNPSGGACHTAERTRKYFGLTESEAEDLFDDHGCGGAETPRMAALFIERFCNRKAKERNNVGKN